MSNDLFENTAAARASGYSAKDIEVLEGLEPVRKRPGMYIGGTDEKALHHLVAEILDNAMDEAVAGHATVIDVELGLDNVVTIRDNGRGIPVDPHPKFPDKSAMEVIFTTLHSGGKFGGGAYKVSGGLHGVGISVVNALSDRLVVEVARDRRLVRQSYSRGLPVTGVEDLGATQNRRGTTVTFHPDADIFGPRARFRPATLYRMTRSKAYLFRGVRIRWKCAPDLIKEDNPTPVEQDIHFPNGLTDFLAELMEGRDMVTPAVFAGRQDFPDDMGSVEWAVAWPDDQEAFFSSYCNTVPTPEGGTHEQGLRNALTKGLRGFGDMVGVKKADRLTPDDVIGAACVMLSCFIREPQFQGQTKEKLASAEATRYVEQALKDQFDHWLSGDAQAANLLMTHVLSRADERQRRKAEKETGRKTATKKLRLPGKLADCSRSIAGGTELFLVEGDSAGGSAKQARMRETQAVLPLRGKILNVASASTDKMRANQELSDLMEALGCGTREHYDEDRLRYEKVVIMTDADVDGAHIASLLMTFFYREMPRLIENGHLFLAIPPLYRLTQGGKSVYARDDADKDRLMKTEFKQSQKVEISRFKGLGEMPPGQLKETTMNPASRSLLQVTIPDGRTEEGREDALQTSRMVERLMGRKPELRFQFIQENARFVDALDI